jgi:hypothetical protein
MKIKDTGPLTREDEKALEAARANFHAMMAPLTPTQRSNRAHALAAGLRTTDPLTRALARQIVDAEKLSNGINAKREELQYLESQVRRGGHRPADPNWKGRFLTRKAELEDELALDHARLVGLAEDPLTGAIRDAVFHFRDERAAQAKRTRLLEAVERQRAQAEQDKIEAQAAMIVRGRPDHSDEK